MLQFCPTELEHSPTLLGLLCNEFNKGLKLASSKLDDKKSRQTRMQRVNLVNLHRNLRRNALLPKRTFVRRLQTTIGGSSGQDRTAALPAFAGIRIGSSSFFVFVSVFN